MKNFTNNFKQFTSRLSARWLIMALMMLVGTSSAWADRVYYVNISKWASVYCYAWKEGGANEAGWPGTSITSKKCNFKVNGYDVYYYDTNGTSDKCIFNNNNSSQSSDLIIANGPYFYGNTARSSVKDIYDNDAWMFYINQDYNTNALCIHNGSSYINGTYVASKNYYISTSKSNVNNKTINVTNNCGSWTGTGGKKGGTTVGTTYVHPGCYYKTGNQGTSIVKAATLSSLSIASSISKTDASSVNVTAKATSSTSSYGKALKAMYFVDNVYVAESAQLSTSGTSTTLDLSSFSDGSHTLSVILTDGTISYPDASTATFTIISCTPSTSITSATLNQNGTISLVGNFTTCGTQYHGFQWRIKGQEWCAENDPNSNSGYVRKQTDVDGEDTDTFTPTAGNTYEFRTYIYGSPWIYSSKTKEVEVPCPTIAAPTFSVSSKIACKNVAFNINDLFPRTDSGAGTLEWYKKDGTKVADPTSVSISATTQYYAVLKDGLCSSANSSNLTVNIYTPAISNIKITPYSYGITVQATIAGSDLQSMIVECIEKGGDWANAKKCNQSLKGSGNATCSIDGLVAGSDYQVRISANTKACSELFTYSAVQDVKTTCDEIPDAPDIITSGVVCPNTNITLSDYNNGIDGVKWYSNPECTTPASATVSISSNKMYYARIEDGGCASDASTLSLTLYPTPQTPVVTFSPNPVGQNKPTTLTVSNYDADFNYTIKKDGESAGDYTAAKTISIGEAGTYEYTVTATSKVCPALTSPSAPVTLEVQEAGVKIAALGSKALYTNDPTHFIPLYVSNEDLAGVGATSVKKYTWQFSANGTSEWVDCTRNYGNFNAKNNKSESKVVVSNGGEKSNNYRANKEGYYRCKLTYNNDEEQVSGNIQVTGTTNNKTNKQHIGITYNLPIISVNTGANSFPSDAGLAKISSDCGSSRYPSIHADDIKKKISVDVMMFNPDGTICYDRKARMNYRGSSSLNFKKKSYAFVTGKEKTKNLDGDVDTGKENLFGLSNGAKDKDWVLYAATPDPSMMRNRLVFDLYKKMRPGEWGVNSMYVELVVNGEYRGVYVLMDKITCNANRVNIKNENGFIVKFDKTDVVDRVENTDGDQKTFATSRTGTKGSSNGIESYGSCIDQRFEIEYPEKEDIDLWDAFYGKVQQRFEDFETALANKDYATVRTLIDYNSWADWFIITELAKNQDGFRASCIFVYDGDKIEARPLWDQELSFNNGTRVKHSIDSPEGLLITTSSVYSDAFYPPFWFTGNKGTSVTGGLLNDPCFVSLVKQKWATYQSGVCSPDAIGDMVEAYNTELGKATNREAARWPYTEAARGTTTDGDYIGYYSQGEGNLAQYSFADSKNAITAWIADRSTALTAGSGLGKAINNLKGEALIFTITPSLAETTPWQQVQLTVNAPVGYEYTLNVDELKADNAIIKENGDSYGIKIPRPAWGVGGNGTPVSKQYNVTATIEVSGENACGTISNNTATSVVKLNDITEACNPEIIKK